MACQIRVLGCSGGVGGERATTSFLLGDSALIDAGSGVFSLTLKQLTLIDHVFLTHAHLDHILALPLLVDSVADKRSKPLIVHALPEVIDALKENIFNDVIWPDFTCIPSTKKPFLVFHEVSEFSTLSYEGYTLKVVPANHGVPACGWEVESNGARWIFSGDTCGHPNFWAQLIDYTDRDIIIIEVSFPDMLSEIAILASHYHSASFAKDLKRANLYPKIWVTHLKPGDEDLIKKELQGYLGERVDFLQNGQVFALS